MARNKKVNTAVETIRANMEKERPKNHPIKEHPLSECDEYIRKLYIDALCVIAQYETKDAEKSLNFVRRVHTGAGLTNDFAEHIKNAMEITVERFGEFIAQCRENKLENIFFVDGLIAACADGTPNSKQVDFISEIADALRISKKNVNHLSELAASILEQSNEKYHAACDKIEAENRWAIICKLGCYIKEFVSGVIIDTKDILWIYSKEMSTFDLNKYAEINSDHVLLCSKHKEVILENQQIFYTQNTKKRMNNWYEDYICIRDVENLFLKGCYIERKFSISNVVDVNISDCKFDFSKMQENDYVCSILNLDNVSNFKFIGSKIMNLKLISYSYGAISLDSYVKMIFYMSDFVNIYKDSYGRGNNSLIIGCGESGSGGVTVFEMDKCTFISCGGRGAVLFPNEDCYISQESTNTFKNCCRLV